MAEKTKGIAAVRALGEADIQEKLKAARRQIWDTRQKLRAGTVQQTHTVRALRKDIAQMHTVLKERRSQPAAKA